MTVNNDLYVSPSSTDNIFIINESSHHGSFYQFLISKKNLLVKLMSILVTLSNKLFDFIRVLVKGSMKDHTEKYKFPRKKGVMLVIFKQDYNYAIERSFCCIFNESIIGCFVYFLWKGQSVLEYFVV